MWDLKEDPQSFPAPAAQLMLFAPLPDLPDRPEVVRMQFTHRPCPFGLTPRTSSRLGDLYLLGQELGAAAPPIGLPGVVQGPVSSACSVSKNQLTEGGVPSATRSRAFGGDGFDLGGG